MTPVDGPLSSNPYPFWTYEDLALFLGAVLPSIALAALVVRISRLSGDAAAGLLLYQSLTYALLLGVLYLVISGRYHQPFWRSLRWTGGYRGAWICAIAGPTLVFGTAILGVVLREPTIPSPLQNLITDRLSLVIAMLFVTILGPVWEELLFRGFLFPLIAKSLGPWAGIVLTAAPFAALHGPQLHWTWQPVFIIGLVGIVFGYTRYRTGSTAASSIVHVSYNVTVAVAFLIQRGA
ncbi:MAG: type II CAAX endopeptidase family protein [Bryobacteraceae bacterium]|jgi:membrane protease YdiL (CAAX protease family)